MCCKHVFHKNPKLMQYANILVKICSTDTNERRLYQHLAITACRNIDIVLDLDVFLSVIPSCSHLGHLEGLKLLFRYCYSFRLRRMKIDDIKW